MIDEMENNYLAAAIAALNKVVTSDVSPRLASKVVRFRKILTDYAATHKDKGTQTAIEFGDTVTDGAATVNADGTITPTNDIYTV